MVYFNVIVIFDNFSGVNVVDNVIYIYKFFSPQELILLRSLSFFGVIYDGLHAL